MIFCRTQEHGATEGKCGQGERRGPAGEGPRAQCQGHAGDGDAEALPKALAHGCYGLMQARGLRLLGAFIGPGIAFDQLLPILLDPSPDTLRDPCPDHFAKGFDRARDAPPQGAGE